MEFAEHGSCKLSQFLSIRGAAGSPKEGQSREARSRPDGTRETPRSGSLLISEFACRPDWEHGRAGAVLGPASCRPLHHCDRDPQALPVPRPTPPCFPGSLGHMQGGMDVQGSQGRWESEEAPSTFEACSPGPGAPQQSEPQSLAVVTCSLHTAVTCSPSSPLSPLPCLCLLELALKPLSQGLILGIPA